MKNLIFTLFFIITLVNPWALHSQNLQLVWADEFDGASIDQNFWEYKTGLTNDNVHFYTDRPANAKLSNGKLQIIALKESYQGFNYTSAQIMTSNSVNWRNGRVEASIKLPATPGFVPAFWMLPAENSYGWWPNSGEIDIMEHPTNQITTIYGTVHTQAYNSFTGSGPRGSIIQIEDAETAFHVYAIEWSDERIDFFVDDQKYFTFENDNGSSDTWPFDQPFYIILNLAVGGGWVGNPVAETIFPAIMEVDYVRVYQKPEDMAILGADFVPYKANKLKYSAPQMEGWEYNWKVPGNAELAGGQGTGEILVDWGIFGGSVELEITGIENFHMEYPVRVTSNILKNGGFEKGVKYWNGVANIPARADLVLSSDESHGGTNSVYVDVKTPGSNAWDIQLSQGNIQLNAGQNYLVSFWAKGSLAGSKINAAIIKSSDFSLLTSKTITLGENWQQFRLDFKASANVTAAFNIDMGNQTGGYYLDDFIVTTAEMMDMNMVKNPDFCEGDDLWSFNTLFPAEALGNVSNGEFVALISNSGVNPWDINIGQSGFVIENGKIYEVSFDAYATGSREIVAFVGKNSDPWDVYSGGDNIAITSSKKTYSYSFNMKQPTDNQARLGFDIGGSDADVFIDNVSMVEVEASPTRLFETHSNDSFFELNMPRPNPFTSEVIFSYRLFSPAMVNVTISNLLGKEIVVLEQGFMGIGEHSFFWNAENLPAGIYIFRFEVDQRFETGKLFLQK